MNERKPKKRAAVPPESNWLPTPTPEKPHQKNRGKAHHKQDRQITRTPQAVVLLLKGLPRHGSGSEK
jgi:hypothetical protein